MMIIKMCQTHQPESVGVGETSMKVPITNHVRKISSFVLAGRGRPIKFYSRIQ